MDSDNSWSNILYILAIAVFGLIKYFFKNKSNEKPVSSADNVNPQEDKKSVFDSLFGEERDTVPEEYDNEEVIVEPEIHLAKDKIEILEKMGDKPAIHISHLMVEDLDSKDFDESEFGGVVVLDKESFNLRNAVIYSEIINTKYC